MIVIFLLALVLFGPNKLPEIGRTIGKAITEFRKASSELKETFTTEYQNLERETESLKQAATQSISEATNDYQYGNNSYSYDYSSYESQTTEESQVDTTDSAASNPSSESASAPQGAELTSAEPPEGVIAHGSVIEEPALAQAAEPEPAADGELYARSVSKLLPPEAAEPGKTGDSQPQEAPASTSAEHNKA
jgi:TatA/E family protein of Tat protein translocase